MKGDKKEEQTLSLEIFDDHFVPSERDFEAVHLQVATTLKCFGQDIIDIEEFKQIHLLLP